MEIKVVNLQGQTIYSTTTTNNNKTINKQIDIRNYANGIYFVYISNEKETLRHKVMVQ